MRFSTVGALAACVAAAAAFKNTSPFILFSTEELQKDAQPLGQIASAGKVLEYTKEFLSGCPSDVYIIVSQPGIDFAILEDNNAGSTLMEKLYGGKTIKGRMAIPEVVGQLYSEAIVDFVKDKCATKVIDVLGPQKMLNVNMDDYSAYPVVGRANYESLAGLNKKRTVDQLRIQQNQFNKLIELAAGARYTVIYVTSPPTSHEHKHTFYEPEFQAQLQQELKRQTDVSNSTGNHTVQDHRPLFQKYQFFTPGLFMGLGVSLLLFSILFVGIRAIAGLEVSYGAFEKDMGPQGHKKVQ